MSCLAERTVAELLAGRLGLEEATRAQQHTHACADCRRRITAAAALDPHAIGRLPTLAADSAPPAPPSAASPSPLLRRGALVGRYVVLDPIGAGGMGVVYAAHDPELDRKVALKLLRADLIPPSALADGRSLLLREAQAMARLSHPNVIAVHDAGTFGDQVFVAMELVDGRTLAAWLRERPRPWRQVLEVFVRAGRGLAAAHQAGLVHRDFKPDNVLVGRDGRVRVTDFGLARPSGAPAAAPTAEGLPSRGPSPLELGLTPAGALIGTPAYMAPEQHAGGSPDARTDQFSFCVALYEGLYGQRPFPGTTLEDLARQVSSGRIDEPRGSGVPAWLRRVVLRGLSVDPAARYGSMEALLSALGRDPRRRWTRALGAAALLLVLFGGAAGGRELLHRARPSCGDARARRAGVWDPTRREAAQRAFAATGRSFAATAFAGSARVLEEYLERWSAMRQDACEATWTRGEQSAELLDLRMQCLDGRLRDVDALADLYTHADGAVVERALEAARGLPSLDGCRDAAALKGRRRPPPGAGVREHADEIEKQVAAARTLLNAGRYAQGLAVAERAAEAARALGWRPLEADALYERGTLEERAGKTERAERTLHEAILAAQAGGNDETAAQAWTHLTYVVGYVKMRHQEAHECARHAAAALERLGGREELEGRLSYTDGSVYLEEGRYDEALEHYRRARGLLERRLGPEHPFVATVIDGMGLVYAARGQNREALEHHSHALALREKALGPDHPYVANSLTNVAGVYWAQARHDEALAAFRRALAIQERALGPDHTDVADSLNNIGLILSEQHKGAEALVYLRRALAKYEQALGPEHPRVALCLDNLGGTFNEMGRPREALAAFQRALRIYEKTRGEDSRDVAQTLHNIATVLRGQKRFRPALADEERALALYRKSGGAELPEVVAVLSGIGIVEMELGAPGPGATALEQAIALRERGIGDPGDLPDLRFTLARALWTRGADRARARALAEQARQAYARAGADNRHDLSEVEAWLAGHRP